jgi:glycosyltransferase involved in cell wall biosynthesis
MKLSHGSRIANYTKRNGYGYMTDRILSTLKTLGYKIRPNDPTADVNFWYDQPHHIDWGENQYRVAYHPWESTELMEGWLEKLNSADEVWTPSPLMAEWYKEMGVDSPIFIYEHGIDQIWTRRPRRTDGIIRFLHVGGEAKRKGADIVLEAFRAAFPGRTDVELTMKMMNKGARVERVGRTTFMNESIGINRLVRLYHKHQVFVYPSWGEGFGLNPLQALATGMPTIFTGAWAPYADYAPDHWKIDSELADSPWPTVHPGKMFKPDLDDLVEKMRYTVDHYEDELKIAQGASTTVQEHYNWKILTSDAFKKLEDRVA